MSAWAVPGFTEKRELGRGASARVVAAIHDGTGQQVAIKYLSPRLLRDPNFLARFREEVEVLRSLDVPQVVRLFAYVEEPGQGAAIVMELVDGVSLHEMITRQGATSPESALVVLKGSLLGLACAHQLGIVHRDYKPKNVLVDGDGNSKSHPQPPIDVDGLGGHLNGSGLLRIRRPIAGNASRKRGRVPAANQ